MAETLNAPSVIKLPVILGVLAVQNIAIDYFYFIVILCPIVVI